MKTIGWLSLCLLAVSGAALAEDPQPVRRLYASASLAYAVLSDHDDAFGPEVSLGYQLDPFNRVELETGYLTTNRGSLLYGKELRLIPVLLKYSRTFPLAPRLSGTAGLAGGAVFERLDDFYIITPATWETGESRESETAGAFGGELGIDFLVNERTSLGLAAAVLALSSTDVVSSNSLALFTVRVAVRF